MGVIPSQTNSLKIVYSTVYSDADQRKHQSSASLAFVRGIHRWPVNSPHKWPVMRKMCPFDDVIMTSKLGSAVALIQYLQCYNVYVLMYCRLVKSNGVSNLGYHCVWQWFVACSVPSHYPNQRWPYCSGLKVLLGWSAVRNDSNCEIVSWECDSSCMPLGKPLKTFHKKFQ